jgi:hypothetical protein
MVGGVSDVACALVWVILKEVQLGTDRPEIAPNCEFGTAPILLVNDPNVRY